MTPEVAWFIVALAFAGGLALILWSRLAGRFTGLVHEVLAWTLGGILLVVFAFWGITLLLGGGHRPTGDDDAWLRAVVTAALPLAGLLGASVAVAISIRRQRTTERADEFVVLRALRERFNDSANQLANNSAAVRLAGVYSLTALAEDWHERGNRKETQVCIDLLCAYLRSPRASGTVTPDETHVRTTISTAIAERLRPPPRKPSDGNRRPASNSMSQDPAIWEGYSFPLNGAVFDDGRHDFSKIRVANGTVLDFSGASFEGAYVTFERAMFGTVDRKAVAKRHSDREATLRFDQASFTAGDVLFQSAEIDGARVTFRHARFDGSASVRFRHTYVIGPVLEFDEAVFAGGELVMEDVWIGGRTSFRNVTVDGGLLTFESCDLAGSQVDFSESRFQTGRLVFERTDVTGGAITFEGASASEGVVRGPWGSGLPTVQIYDQGWSP